jgi:hypothetical protein
MANSLYEHVFIINFAAVPYAVFVSSFVAFCAARAAAASYFSRDCCSRWKESEPPRRFGDTFP